MSALRDVLGFLSRPWIWFTLVFAVLLLTGVLSSAEAKEMFGKTVDAVKDWSLFGGAP